MMACELAAHKPERVSKMVLLDPIGLWRDDAPVAPYMLMTPEDLAGTLFHNLNAQPVQEFLTMPTDPKELGIRIAESVWALGTTGKFVWPIPDKGLKKRIHRITAPTLIIWGKQDGIVPPIYAQEFADRIGGARVEMIDGAAHLPQIEQTEKVSKLVADFLAK